MSQEKSGKSQFTARLKKEQEQFEKQINAEAVIEEAQATAKEEERKKEMTILDELVLHNHVTASTVNDWKSMYGKIFATIIDIEDEVYIYRPLSRIEWRKIDKDVSESKMQNKAELIDEMIVAKCMLYPPITEEWRATVSAGTYGLISSQIQLMSNFLPQSAVIELIRKI